MKIYIAGYFDTRDRLRTIRDQIWAMGHEVVSTWLDEAAKPVLMPTEEFFTHLAIKDLTEIKSADCLIIDTIDLTPRGGREVEFGYALGQVKLKAVVGPTRHIFHLLAAKRFPNWVECLLWLKQIPSDLSSVSSVPHSPGQLVSEIIEKENNNG